MNKLTKLLKLIALSLLFAIVSFWSNLTKAQEQTATLRMETPCFSVTDFQKQYKDSKVLMRQFGTVGKEPSQDLLVGLSNGDLLVLRQVGNDICIITSFDKQQRM